MRFTSLLALSVLFAGNVYAQDDLVLGDLDTEAVPEEDLASEAAKNSTMVEKVETKTCDSVEECGEVVDPPYYYDWTNKPSGLYTVNNIFALQTTIIGIVFAGESYLKADVLVKS